MSLCHAQGASELLVVVMEPKMCRVGTSWIALSREMLFYRERVVE